MSLIKRNNFFLLKKVLLLGTEVVHKTHTHKCEISYSNHNENVQSKNIDITNFLIRVRYLYTQL